MLVQLEDDIMKHVEEGDMGQLHSDSMHQWICKYSIVGNPLRLGLLMAPISPEVLGMQPVPWLRVLSNLTRNPFGQQCCFVNMVDCLFLFFADFRLGEDPEICKETAFEIIRKRQEVL